MFFDNTGRVAVEFKKDGVLGKTGRVVVEFEGWCCFGKTGGSCYDDLYVKCDSSTSCNEL